jgi:integrating conjugative element protein (TIGR03749 family)
LALLALLPALAQPAPELPPLPDPLRGGGLPDPPERLVWHKTPLAITLPVGRERLVTFPVPVRIGVPPDLGGEVLRTQIVNGTVYWTALKAFKPQRIQVEEVGTGNIVLMDLAASKSVGDAPPIEVAVAGARGAAAPGAAAPAAEPPKPKELDYAGLVRVAAQHLYGPLRLRRVPEGVHAAPAGGGEADRSLIRGGAIDAQPLAAWRSGRLYVTAVKLRNRIDSPQDLDPRRLRGRWLAAAFQHARLAPWGDLRDTTAVYLISDQPYPEALHGG